MAINPPLPPSPPLCVYELPDHFADYQITDGGSPDPIGSCAAHLSASVDWRVHVAPPITIITVDQAAYIVTPTSAAASAPEPAAATEWPDVSPSSSAAELITATHTASEAQLDVIESYAAGRVTVLDAVATRRDELANP